MVRIWQALGEILCYLVFNFKYYIAKRFFFPPIQHTEYTNYLSQNKTYYSASVL